jgi:hypothetical protein
MANVEFDPLTGLPRVAGPLVLPPNKTPSPTGAVFPNPHEPPPVHSPIVNLSDKDLPRENQSSDAAVTKLAEFMMNKPDPSLTELDELEKSLDPVEEARQLAEMRQANKPTLGKQTSKISPVTPTFKSVGDENIPLKLELIRTLFRNCGMDSMQQQRTFVELIKILGWS